MSRCACMTGDEASKQCSICPYSDRIRAAAIALHEWTETNFVNKGMRRKWGDDVVDRNGYLDQAKAALIAADGVPQIAAPPLDASLGLVTEKDEQR